MKFFNRIALDPEHPGARDAAAQCMVGTTDSDHQFLWRFFPAPNGAARDFLFRRFEPPAGDQQPQFFCVSARPAVAPHPAWQVNVVRYEPKVDAGERFHFDLRLNPTQAHKRDGKAVRDDVVMHYKKRVMAEHGVHRWADVPAAQRPPLYEIAHTAVREWLGSAAQVGFAARHGFSVADDLRVDSYRQHRLARGGAAEMSLSTVDLSGTLQVVDARLFEKALLVGVGRAKGFGCGLLLVRRT